LTPATTKAAFCSYKLLGDCSHSFNYPKRSLQKQKPSRQATAISNKEDEKIALLSAFSPVCCRQATAVCSIDNGNDLAPFSFSYFSKHIPSHYSSCDYYQLLCNPSLNKIFARNICFFALFMGISKINSFDSMDFLGENYCVAQHLIRKG